MVQTSTETVSANASWRPGQVYVMAAICLVLGLAIGYLFRGSATSGSSRAQAASASASGAPAMPSLEQMKHLADKQAEPLLAKLTSTPNDAQLLVEISRVYKSAHQFKEGAGYLQRAVDVNPKDVAVRTELGSCLYYTGDVDGAIGQLNEALKIDPKDANALFNLGVIEFEGRKNASGAMAAWNQLLKANPKLEKDKRVQVEQLIAQAKQAKRD